MGSALSAAAALVDALLPSRLRIRDRETSLQVYDPLYAAVAGGATVWALGAHSLPVAVSAASCVAAGTLFALRRYLPDVSQAALEAAEAGVLKASPADVEHRWTNVEVEVGKFRGVFHVHSLFVAGPRACSETVVLIHGHSAGAALWEAVFQPLSKAANVLVLDMPGWGRSLCPPQFNTSLTPLEVIDIQVALLASWIRLNVDGPVSHLLAHSYGGFLGTHLAFREPDLVQHLILCSPGGLLPVMPSATWLWGIWFRAITPQRVLRLTGRLGALLVHRLHTAFAPRIEVDKSYGAYYVQAWAATGRPGRGAADALMAKFVSYRVVGNTVTCYWSHPVFSLLLALPTQLSLVWGEKDDLISSRFGSLLYSMRPDTDFLIVKGGAHNPAHNKPLQFCKALTLAMAQVNAERKAVAMAGKLGAVSRAHGVFDVVHPAVEIDDPAVAHYHGEKGSGRGFCASCGEEVHLFKSYWRCGCCNWTFNAFVSVSATESVVSDMLSFLEELYVDGTFDAKSCAFIRQTLPNVSTTFVSSPDRSPRPSIPARPRSNSLVERRGLYLEV